MAWSLPILEGIKLHTNARVGQISLRQTGLVVGRVNPSCSEGNSEIQFTLERGNLKYRVFRRGE